MLFPPLSNGELRRTIITITQTLYSSSISYSGFQTLGIDITYFSENESPENGEMSR